MKEIGIQFLELSSESLRKRSEAERGENYPLKNLFFFSYKIMLSFLRHGKIRTGSHPKSKLRAVVMLLFVGLDLI